MGYITFYDQPSWQQNDGEVDIRKERWIAWAKIGTMVGFGLMIGGMLLFYSQKQPIIAEEEGVRSAFGKIEYTAPYKKVLYENFGFVDEPKLTFPLKTKQGYKEVTFLLDSGAVVSALPLQAARDVGIDFSQAKRITLQGFSGIPTFAYFGEITIKIGEEEFAFPAVFTESNGTSYILGRKGFFDQFEIHFDNKEKQVTISTKRKKR